LEKYRFDWPARCDPGGAFSSVSSPVVIRVTLDGGTDHFGRAFLASGSARHLTRSWFGNSDQARQLIQRQCPAKIVMNCNTCVLSLDRVDV
jgi:hypothetical protein